MQEKRRETRDKTYLGAQIAFNNRATTAEFLVRNLSTTGARLQFASTIGLPSIFDLTIRHKGDSRRARLIWRTNDALGVVLEAPYAATVISIESARH